MIWECGVLMSTYFRLHTCDFDILSFVVGELSLVAKFSLVFSAAIC